MTSALDHSTNADTAHTCDLLGIVQVSVPVTDLARSAAWYRDLLDLDYVREFRDDERVTGCALADFHARYLIALRLRSTTQGNADLRGEHPIILEARDADAAERLRAHATALGVAWTSGTHADGTWTQFVDPDGMCLRIIHDAAGPQAFLGVHFGPGGATHFYETPRLVLAQPPISAKAISEHARA
jgi:catechol 2,3-dioxygenase-like lactoylglutathione lyase family enzyme